MKIKLINLDDIDKLVQYIMNEADVIKIAAYNRLKELYRVIICFYFIIHIIR
jgi:hypothetical protein